MALPWALKASEVFQGLAWDDVAASPQTRPVLHRPAGITFPLERRSRWAEPGLKGETERRGASSPYGSSRLGIWESPHLSLDLGESPHPVS